jgi:transcriptional antiterminator NusG
VAGRSFTHCPEKMRKMTLHQEQLFSPSRTVPAELCEHTANAAELRRWFAVFTRSHHEKRVALDLTERGIQSFLPLYQAVHQWTNHRKAALDLPLFPNYLFVHIAPRERIRTLGVSGIVSMVSKGKVPVPLPDAEIELLRTGLHLRNFEPHPYLAVGVKARIAAGPLAGMEGIVVRKKSGLRVVLTVNLIMQSVAVEVAADELEPHGSSTDS